jgi:hypothetical protein
VQSSFPKTVTPKNKVQTPVLFSDHEKVSVKTPRLPHTPPQIHHDLPSQNTPKTHKSPIKPPPPPQAIFPAQILHKIVLQGEHRFSESCIGNRDARAETKDTME